MNYLRDMPKSGKSKNRILCFITPSYKDQRYLEAKKIYQKNLYEMHKRFLKLKSVVDPTKTFSITLIGFDGTCKKRYRKLNVTKLFSDIEKMPMGYLRKNVKKTNLSLYANYKPKTTLQGTGFKDSDVAKHTLKLIKDRDLSYQKRVVQTMLNRAKYHPHQTKGMKEAISIFQKWLDNDHKRK